MNVTLRLCKLESDFADLMCVGVDPMTLAGLEYDAHHYAHMFRSMWEEEVKFADKIIDRGESGQDTLAYWYYRDMMIALIHDEMNKWSRITQPKMSSIWEH